MFPDFTEILTRLATSRVGVTVRTSDPVRLRTLWYKWRSQQMGIPPISCFISPKHPDSELWFFNGKPQLNGLAGSGAGG